MQAQLVSALGGHKLSVSRFGRLNAMKEFNNQYTRCWGYPKTGFSGGDERKMPEFAGNRILVVRTIISVKGLRLKGGRTSLMSLLHFRVIPQNS